MTKFERIAIYLLAIQTIFITCLFMLVFMMVFDVGYITSELVRAVISDLR